MSWFTVRTGTKPRIVCFAKLNNIAKQRWGTVGQIVVAKQNANETECNQGQYR